jgi:ATP-dependent Lon protease
MATALASLITGRPVRPDVGMTGEITLRGQVLPIGGIKEKVLAAHRAGLKTVIIPKRNEKDLEDVPEEVRTQLHFVLADRVEDVLEAALEKTKSGNGRRRRAANGTGRASRAKPAAGRARKPPARRS